MNVMCSSGEPTYCNRRPFVSEDGCDRGSVDIHQFDELPYCKGINPTSPDIPPEIVDTPISLPVPPPCSCFNLDFKFPVLKYHKDRAFSTSVSFWAQGDCCEGNYRTDFKIKIPCPVIGNGPNKIAVGLKYGTGRSKNEKTYITKDDANCTVTPEDVDIDLEIHCPASGTGDREIKAEGRWAKGFSEAAAKFVSIDGGDCNVEFFDNKIDLDIACPIHGRGDNKITAEIAYGNGPTKDETVFLRENPGECTIEGADADLSLQIPCPVKSSNQSKIKIGIDYGTGFKADEQVIMRQDAGNCAIIPESPSLNLAIPCPLDGVSIKGERGIVVTEGGGGTCFKEFTVGLDADEGELDIPCPISGEAGARSVKVKVTVAGESASDSATFITMDPAGCNISAEDASLHINVPCPLSVTGYNKMHIGFDTIKYDGMSGAFDTIGGLDDLGWSGIEVDSCRLTLRNKTFRLKALPPTNSDRLEVTYSTHAANGNTGEFYVTSTYDSSHAKRKFNFSIRFPEIANVNVVSRLEWSNHVLRYKTINIITGEEASSWETLFTAVAHTGCC